MSRLRIAFLNASSDTASTSRNFRREVDADLAEFDASAGKRPADFDYDAAIVSGSRASVYWDEGWIDPLEDWIREATDRDLPVLGVCFGHQLVASALGGRVEGMGEYELGYREVEHDGSPLFEGIDDRFTVFTTHSDEVTELPPGAELLAENEYGIHAFRKGHAFGVQFHPEYDMETAASVTRGKDSVADEKIEAVLDGINEENYRAACEAKQVFENFTSYVREVRDVEAAPAR